MIGAEGITAYAYPANLHTVLGFINPHCVATTVTFCVVFASEEIPGPDGLTIKLFPEIAKTP